MSESKLTTEEPSEDEDIATEPLLENRHVSLEVNARELSAAEESESEQQSTTETRLATRPLVVLLAGALVCCVGLVVGFGFFTAPGFLVGSVLVPAVGLGATLLGVGWTVRQFADSAQPADSVVVEDPVVTVPGADVDHRLRAERDADARYEQRTAIRRRLRRLAAEYLVQSGKSVAETNEALAGETWTDDPNAASFFTFEGSNGRLSRLRERLRRRSRFERQARHTVDAIARLAGLTDRSWTDPQDAGEHEDVTTSTGAEPASDGDQPRARTGGRTRAIAAGRAATHRLRLVSGLVLTAVGLGILFRLPTLLLSGAVGTGLLAHRYAGGVPDPKLGVERTVSETDPEPGDVVTVTTTVENEGDRTLYDLRLVDGVPPALGVVDGSPRLYTGLRPGATATFSYDLRIGVGRHEFDPLGVFARSASGATERRETVEADTDITLRCQPRPTEGVGVPLQARTSRRIGSVVTDTGGPGIEFHSSREYRSGDPLRRIDWRRLARGGDLATLQFNVERAATVVLLVDTRTEAYVAPRSDAPMAIERSSSAAASAVRDLLQHNDSVGLGTVGPTNCWIPPRAGRRQWPIVRDALGSHEAFAYPDDDEHFLPHGTLHWLRTRLPENVQVVFFTPLADDESLSLCRRLQAHGYPLTVVSPRTTTTATPGRTVAHLERRRRLSRLRTLGLSVIDWGPDEQLQAAFERSGQGGGR